MIKKIAYIIISLFLLSLFAAAIKHVSGGGKKLGLLTKPLLAFSSFPELVSETFKEISSLPQQYQKTPKDFETINNLSESVYVLASISEGYHSRKIILKDLKDDKIKKIWEVDYYFESSDRIFAPLMLQDSSFILNVSEKTLLKIDNKGKLVWQIEKPMTSHHCLNQDSDGDIWTLGKLLNDNNKTLLTHQIKFGANRDLNFNDEIILKFNTDGEILYQKSILDIFLDNNLEDLFHKAQFVEGPFHSNDVEPINVSSNMQQKGDILISLRNMSTIIHYRPSENKVVHVVQGPFSFQHDVDYINDSVVSLFNNNTFNQISKKDEKRTISPNIIKLPKPNSEILLYNFNDKQFTSPFKEIFQEYKIFTHYEGLVHWLDKNTVLVEEQEKGVLWVLKPDKVLYKNVIPSEKEGYHQMLNWTRVIDVK